MNNDPRIREKPLRVQAKPGHTHPSPPSPPKKGGVASPLSTAKTVSCPQGQGEGRSKDQPIPSAIGLLQEAQGPPPLPRLSQAAGWGEHLVAKREPIGYLLVGKPSNKTGIRGPLRTGETSITFWLAIWTDNRTSLYSGENPFELLPPNGGCAKRVSFLPRDTKGTPHFARGVPY